MEIKVIGIGPDGQKAAKELSAAFEKILGAAPKEEGPQPTEEDLPDGFPTAEEFKRAKKHIKKSILKMGQDGLGIDVASMAMSEVTCIMFSGMLKPIEGKTSKEAFMDYIGTVFDSVEKKVKEVRAKREEACNGR